MAELGQTYRDGSSAKPGYTYHLIEGYTFPTHTTACEQELHAMDFAEFDGKTVLDLGCNCGYFAFRLAERGATVHGVDADPRNIAVCEALKNELYSDLDVTFEVGDIARVTRTADICLLLNVHHWLVKQNGFDGALDILTAIRADELFFQTAHAGSRAMSRVTELESAEDIEDMLRAADWEPELILENPAHGGIRYLYYCT